MTTVTVNLADLTDEQLTAAVLIMPEAVQEERARRRAYPDIPTGVQDVKEAYLEFTNYLQDIRKSPIKKKLLETGLLDRIERFIATAEANLTVASTVEETVEDEDKNRDVDPETI
jgi:hypothetical protein